MNTDMKSMKTMVYVMTVAMLPLFGSGLSRAQEDTAPPADEGKAAAGAGGKVAADPGVKRVQVVRAAQASGSSSSPFVGGGGGAFSDRLQRIVTSQPGGAAKPLVLRSSDMDAKAQGNLEEDLAVMDHLLEKAVAEVSGKERPYEAMGINLFFGPALSSMHGLYLDGYGSLFMLTVGFPLLPPPPKVETNHEEAEKDSAWEEARQEVYGQPPGAGLPGSPGEAFSEEKVNALKTKLLESLKSASNIRQMKDDDFVTVCVFGGAGGNPAKVQFKTAARAAGGAGTIGPGAGSSFGVRQGGGQRGTIMTLRVKKADVDAFAKGKMDLERFRKQARIEIYAGGPTTSGIFTSRSIGGGGGGFGGGGFGGGGF
jgi:hypothetical protein